MGTNTNKSLIIDRNMKRIHATSYVGSVAFAISLQEKEGKAGKSLFNGNKYGCYRKTGMLQFGYAEMNGIFSTQNMEQLDICE